MRTAKWSVPHTTHRPDCEAGLHQHNLGTLSIPNSEPSFALLIFKHASCSNYQPCRLSIEYLEPTCNDLSFEAEDYGVQTLEVLLVKCIDFSHVFQFVLLLQGCEASGARFRLTF